MRVTLALALTLFATASAQTPQFTDPANLRGERVAPRTGRELPIDQSEAEGGRGLEQLLRKLNTRASLMLIVGHPDDEDGGMLTLYSRGMGARVADLSLNRGEGGQNAMTGDFEDALGLLRTQELLSADRYSGVDQFFGTEVDFGFSKTKEESFAKWGHDRVLYDVVRSIRLYRPLVIASVFIGGVTDGHGQHQVAGQIAQEAFKAAGDPTVFPDMIAEGILPWQPLKVYARVPTQSITPQGLFDYATNQYAPARFTNYVTGEVNTTPPSVDVVIHEGATDPLLTRSGANAGDLASSYLAASSTAPNAKDPLSYVQFARIGLGLQKSQIGPGVRLAPTGAFDIGYHLYGSVLCDAPPSARPPSWTPQNCHPERSSSPATNAVEGPASLLAAAKTPASSGPDPQDVGLFTGVDTSIEGIANLALSARGVVALVLQTNLLGIQHSIAEAALDFKPGQPSLAANRLEEALTLADMTIKNIENFNSERLSVIEKADILHELRIKRVQLNDALVVSLGLQFSASVSPGVCGSPSQRLRTDWLLPTQPGCVEIHLSERSAQPVTPMGIFFTGFSADSGGQQSPITVADTALAAETRLPLERSLTLPVPGLLAKEHNSSSASPFAYFGRDDIESPVYYLLDPALRNAPGRPPTFPVTVTLQYEGANITLSHVLEMQQADGEGFVPLALIQNEVGVSTPTSKLAFPRSQSALDVSVRVENYSNRRIDSKLGFMVMGWADFPKAVPFMLGRAPYDSRQSFTPTAPMPRGYAKPPTISPFAVVPPGGKPVETRGSLLIATNIHRIGYGNLPPSYQSRSATVTPVPVDLRLPDHHRIAYLAGTGDAVPDALASVGLAPTILTVADLTPGKLKAFDTVILGVRTYNAHPDLHGTPTQALLEFAHAGGNVVVQYQTPEFTAADAPYPLSLGSNEKVVDETAPVQLLDELVSSGAAASTSPVSSRDPEASASRLRAAAGIGALARDALLHTPNQIEPADFNGWIEERGHGFLASWDDHYRALTETHDPGQAPQRGGLITTKLGKGRWTYCAFALYRQLPEAVPGAFRLFVNLLDPHDEQLQANSLP